MIKFRFWETVLIVARLILILSISAIIIQSALAGGKAIAEEFYQIIPAICFGTISIIALPIASKFQKKALCEEFALCAARKLEQYGGTARRVETHVRNTEENIEIDIFIYGNVPQYTEVECRRSFNRRAADIYRAKNKSVLFNFQTFQY